MTSAATMTPVKADAKSAETAPDPGKPVLLQPTVGAVISEWRRRRNTQPPA